MAPWFIHSRSVNSVSRWKIKLFLSWYFFVQLPFKSWNIFQTGSAKSISFSKPKRSFSHVSFFYVEECVDPMWSWRPKVCSFCLHLFSTKHISCIDASHEFYIMSSKTKFLTEWVCLSVSVYVSMCLCLCVLCGWVSPCVRVWLCVGMSPCVWVLLC